VKTTLEIPDPVFRRAKAKAAERGLPLREYVTQALREKLAEQPRAGQAARPWMEGFGRLRSLRRETQRIQGVIDKEFGEIEPEDRR
jgi:hypothetical protein